MTATPSTPDTRSTTITAREGGIMTTEVGTITGEVEVVTSIEGEVVATRVRYAGADEWYTPEALAPVGADVAKEHERAVAALSTPTPTANPEDADDPAPGRAPRQDATDPAAGSFGSALGG